MKKCALILGCVFLLGLFNTPSSHAMSLFKHWKHGGNHYKHCRQKPPEKIPELPIGALGLLAAVSASVVIGNKLIKKKKKD